LPKCLAAVVETQPLGPLSFATDPGYSDGVNVPVPLATAPNGLHLLAELDGNPWACMAARRGTQSSITSVDDLAPHNSPTAGVKVGACGIVEHQ
jgi:hypothetical protein